jgi:hypothetical protein
VSISLAIDDGDLEFEEWPGERVETRALITPNRIPKVAPVSIESPLLPSLLPAPAVESLVTADALRGVALAIAVLSAGSGAFTALVAWVVFP